MAEDLPPTPFTVGMPVAYVQTWPLFVVISIMSVTRVGKRDIHVSSGRHRFKRDGTTWAKSPYNYRAIKPLTKKLLLQAIADCASDTSIALGHVLPEG
jgi:hypothetical protein